MKRTISSLLIKVSILLVAFFLGLAARSHAQNPSRNQTSPQSDSTRHHYGMHHGWGNGRGGDSLARHDGWASRDGQRRGFERSGRGHGRFGRSDWSRRDRILYTPEQRKQLMAINKDFKQKSATLFAQDNITLKQYKAGLIALQKDKKANLQPPPPPKKKEKRAPRRKRMSENAQVMAVARLERLRLH